MKNSVPWIRQRCRKKQHCHCQALSKYFLSGRLCLVINSQVKEKNKETGDNLFSQFEVNLPTEELQKILQKVFDGWDVIKSTVRAQQYDIPREGCISELSTNVVTFVARKGE